MSSCETFVSRRRASDGTMVIYKTMRRAEWQNLMYMQNQPISVPRVLSQRPISKQGVLSGRGALSEALSRALPGAPTSQGEPDSECVEVCMEDVGATHLETVPERFADALRLLRDIRELPVAANTADVANASRAVNAANALGLGPGAPITLESLHREVEQTFDMDWVAATLGCSEHQRRLIQRAVEACANIRARPQQDWMVPAHGDFHPRNILVRDDSLVRDGSLVVIDWEWAGQHSVFRDIHALVDMCYPDADALLLDQTRLRFRHQALRDAEAELGLATGSLDDGYKWFLLLERLLECRNIAGDMANNRRNQAKLEHQVMFVLRDLEKLLWRWITWTSLPS